MVETEQPVFRICDNATARFRRDSGLFGGVPEELRSCRLRLPSSRRRDGYLGLPYPNGLGRLPSSRALGR
eukprot:scaffold7168_cov182-Amphora_coffeaeformis.AAC.10